MKPAAGSAEALEPVVQEYVLNTYTRFDGYDVAAADAYWAATKDYWAAVRAKWAEVAERKSGIALEEEAQAGTVISGRLLELGSALQDGEVSQSAASEEAIGLIETHTR